MERTNKDDAELLRRKMRNFLHVFDLTIRDASELAGERQNFLMGFLRGLTSTLPTEALRRLSLAKGVDPAWWESKDLYPPGATDQIPVQSMVQVIGEIPHSDSFISRQVEALTIPAQGAVIAYDLAEPRGPLQRGDVLVCAVCVPVRAGGLAVASGKQYGEVAVAERVGERLELRPMDGGPEIRPGAVGATVVQVIRSRGPMSRIVIEGKRGLTLDDFELITPKA